jgi:catechol 2,3-dioxygenase-like lactoylglutathione lyase family enzyme
MSVVGSARLEDSLRFYRDVIGLDVEGPFALSGPEFEQHWRLPAGASANAALCRAGESPVGKVLLLDFPDLPRHPVRAPGQDRHLGVWNLNFYTLDIEAASRAMADRGYMLWSEPTRHDFAAEVGTPTEVLFEGPDGVVINLVQLPAQAGTRVGEMRAYLEERGTTPAGFTEVVTSAHCVRDMAAAVRFYRDVIGMDVLIDAILDKPEQNRFLHLPEDARTHSVFVKGDHMFGKIALSQPLNYEVDDLIAIAAPPNIGYLAMAFEVESVDWAIAQTLQLGGGVFSPPVDIDLPGFGRRRSAIVRAPSSGALQELIEHP